MAPWVTTKSCGRQLSFLHNMPGKLEAPEQKCKPGLGCSGGHHLYLLSKASPLYRRRLKTPEPGREHKGKYAWFLAQNWLRWVYTFLQGMTLGKHKPEGRGQMPGILFQDVLTFRQQVMVPCWSDLLLRDALLQCERKGSRHAPIHRIPAPIPLSDVLNSSQEWLIAICKKGELGFERMSFPYLLWW